MRESNPTQHWQLLVIRGLMYGLMGASLVLISSPFTALSAQLIGGLLLAAGVCGCVYAVYSLQADRNYFWELLRSILDLGFGIAFLVYTRGELNRFLDVLGFWAVMYAFIQAVQAMYIFMLSGGKQPRNVLGNLLHFLSVVLAGGLGYLCITSAEETIPFTLLGLFLALLGLIIIVLAVQQRQTLLVNKSV